MEDSIIKYFQYFYSKVSGHTNYQFRPTIQEESMIGNFCKSFTGLTKSVLFDYMSFQFYYWHDKDTMFGRGRVQFNWVIGKKAYDRWRKSKENSWSMYSTVLNEKFGVLRSDLIVPKKVFDIDNVELHEDKDRMLYHNTPQGLIFCSDYTSMWHPNSKACSSCNNVKYCKTLMSKSYSLVFQRRGGVLV